MLRKQKTLELMIILYCCNEEQRFFIKYISYFILERGTQFVASLTDRWRDIYSERGLLLAPYILPGARGVPTLAPPY